jgi:hypothetical protein
MRRLRFIVNLAAWREQNGFEHVTSAGGGDAEPRHCSPRPLFRFQSLVVAIDGLQQRFELSTERAELSCSHIPADSVVDAEIVVNQPISPTPIDTSRSRDSRRRANASSLLLIGVVTCTRYYGGAPSATSTSGLSPSVAHATSGRSRTAPGSGVPGQRRAQPRTPWRRRRRTSRRTLGPLSARARGSSSRRRLPP